MERKIMKRFFGLADFLEEQKFLEEQHQSGWKFVYFRPLRKYMFEKCEPENYVYQLDYKENDEGDDEYIQMFIDCGWEYIMKYQTWYYFRKPKSLTNAKDNEILSDSESKIDMVKKVMWRTLFITGVCLCIPAMMYFMNVLMFENKDVTYIFIMSFYAIILMFLLSLNVYNVIKLNRLINQLQYPLDD